MIKHRRVQHPIGQGCFHTGEIRIGESQLYYIYDCGSENQTALSNQIMTYTSFIRPKPALNVLFLSHLDSDHVNGLDCLLATTSVNIVVLPYLSSYEKLLITTEAMVADQINGTFLELMSDPTGWFGNRGVSYVIYVRGDEDPPEEEGIRLPEPGDSPVKGIESLKIDLQHVRMRSTGRRTKIGNTVEEGIISHIHPLPVLANGHTVNWVFLTHVYPEDKRIVRRFSRVVKERLGPFRFNSAYANPSFVKWALGILQNPSRRETLAECYEEIRRDRNCTSLSLYSGPIRLNSSDFAEIDSRYGRLLPYSGSHQLPLLWTKHKQRCGWLGCGDANLRTKKRRQAFLKHFRPIVDLLSTMALPHHGSVHNFHPELLVPQINIFSVSAGENNRYGHPDDKVERTVFATGRHLCITTERPATMFTEYVRLGPGT
jgi:hypothetical protein